VVKGLFVRLNSIYRAVICFGLAGCVSGLESSPDSKIFSMWIFRPGLDHR